MNTEPEETRELVREKYGEIARGASSCCGEATSCCGETMAAAINREVREDYTDIDGYVPEADLHLGCGVPTEHAGIQPGMTVLDLGSGAGNDVFVARRIVGDAGRVIGIDFTPEMVAKARRNLEMIGTTNVEFHLGEIEKLPVEDASVDVVISNCVLNLVPDKERAFAEIHRVLKPGGHFCVSDIVIKGHLPDSIRSAAELYVGCVGGALQKCKYLSLVERAGFVDITTPVERNINMTEFDLSDTLTKEDLAAFRESGTRILSLTVHAGKSQTGRVESDA
jgi:SAM-dependent methyltransferase